MSLAADQMSTNVPFDVGSVLQVSLTASNINLSTSIAGSGSNASQIVLTNGFKNFAFGLTSTQSGTVSVQRYLDQAATVKQGSAVTGTLVANTALTVNSTDSNPYQSMIITVTNGSGSAATLSNVLLLLQAN